MGFSILSLVEIIYYVTLRLVCNLKRQKEGNPENSVEDLSEEKSEKLN